jgi:flagellar hook-associated protein 1
MSLTSAFQIGRSALQASQIAIQTAGNNMANAATPGYSRQLVSLFPTADHNYGSFFVGRGVQIGAVRRQVDSALQARLQSSVSQQSFTQSNLQLLADAEATLNALADPETGANVGLGLSRFFNAWSNLANNPNDPAFRAPVAQQGQMLATQLRDTRARLVEQRTQIDQDLNTAVSTANDLLSRIANINAEIVRADGATGNANTLRDQRDALVGQLAELMDVNTIDQPNGTQDVFVGSTPLVTAGTSSGIQLTMVSTATGAVPRISTTDGEGLDINAGRIGSLLVNRTGLADDTLNRLDAMASQLIFQVNRAHSVGYGTAALTDVTGTRTTGAADYGLAFNDPANATYANLPFGPTNGSFLVTMTNTSTGAAETVRVNVDLDGIDSTGAAGFADDTSLTTLTASLNGISNLSASITSDGKLRITAASGYKINLSDDSSGVLATLGVNTYFTGTDASDIGVRAELVSNPGLLATGRIDAGQPVDNAAARAIADVRIAALTALGGATLSSYWDDTTTSIGTRTAAAHVASDAATIVKDNLESQRAAVSGVNIDEEAINLITFQRQYAASARFISVVDEMTQTLLALTA